MTSMRNTTGPSAASLQLSVFAATALGFVAAAIGIGFGTYWLQHTEMRPDRYGDLNPAHTSLATGFVVLAFGLLLAILAWMLANDYHGQLGPRRHLEAQARAAAPRDTDL